MVEQHAHHLQRHDVGIAGRRLGDAAQLVGQAEGIKIAHPLVRRHGYGHAPGSHAQLYILQDDGLRQRRERSHPRGQCAFGRVRTNRGRAGQHFGSVPLFHADLRKIRAMRRYRRAHLLPFEHGAAIMSGDAARGEPRLAPQRIGERIELAEMSRPLDRPAPEPQLAGRVVIMDRRVPVIALRIQHLPRRTPWPP